MSNLPMKNTVQVKKMTQNTCHPMKTNVQENQLNPLRKAEEQASPNL